MEDCSRVSIDGPGIERFFYYCRSEHRIDLLNKLEKADLIKREEIKNSSTMIDEGAVHTSSTRTPFHTNYSRKPTGWLSACVY